MSAALIMSAIMSACQQSPTAPESVANAIAAPGNATAVLDEVLALRADKVDVCHREGNGSFHLINISGNALPAHLAHGDGQPGGLVPGTPAKQFDSACRQVDVVLRTGFLRPEACGQTVNLSCPAGTVIKVQEGLYGQNCADQNYVPPLPFVAGDPDKTAHLALACNGSQSCNYLIDCSPTGIGDPFFLCRKEYRATWTCVAP